MKQWFIGGGIVWCLVTQPIQAAVGSVHRPLMDESVTRPVAENSCPTNLRALLPKMEKILALLTDRKFKRTMRESLAASIPEAIRRADGLNAHIAGLARDIREGERRLRHVEKVAREASANLTQPLTPCKRGEKGSYCRAVEEYHTRRALVLAQRAFLYALLCYRDHGLR